jgi:hypothetical protein
MRSLAILATWGGCVALALVALAGCEVLVGIKDKTLVAADGGPGDAEDPSAPCSQQPTPYLFCDDFDSELEAGDGWEWILPADGGTIALDTVRYKTPPRSVQVTVPSAPGSAQLGYPVGSLTTGYRLAFDLFVDVPDLASIPQVAVAQVLPAGPSGLQLDYVLGPGSQCAAQLFGSTNATLTLPLPPLRTWTRIVLVYDAVQGVSILEDGQTLATSSAVTGPPGATSFIVGAVYSNPPGTAPLVLELDDVVMRGQ